MVDLEETLAKAYRLKGDAAAARRLQAAADEGAAASGGCCGTPRERVRRYLSARGVSATP